MNPVTCEQCGGINQPEAPPPWACRFCGVPMAAPDLPEGRIWMTDVAVHGLAASRLTGVDCTYIHPSIPEKKLASVRKVHAAHLPQNEHVLALYDGTAFGSASEGFVITSRRICWKHTMEQAMSLEWAQIDPDEIYADENTLVLGRVKLDTFFGEDDDGLWAWTEVFETLARSARPYDPSKDEYDDGEKTRETDPAWGGPDVSVGGRTQSGGWGGMTATPSAHAWQAQVGGFGIAAEVPEIEHLGGAPYQSDESVSVVDVHPSGELFVAAGSDRVEVKYASNGQRYLAFPTPGSVLCARFSPDGHWLLVACTDRRVYLHDVRSAQRRGATEKMGDYCDEVVWLAGNRFAAASQQGELWIVDATTMLVVKPVLRPDVNYDHLGGLAASPDGNHVFVAVGDKIGSFDTVTGQILWRLDDSPLHSPRLTMSPRGDALVAAGSDGVMFIDAETGQPGMRHVFRSPRAVSWPESGAFLKSRRDDRFEWSWSPRPAFSPTGDVVAVQDPVGNLCFLDVATAALHGTPRQQGAAWIEAIAWFRDGNHVLLGMSDNSVAIWSVRPMVGRLHCAGIGELPPEAYAGLPTDDDATELDDGDLEEVG